MWPSFKGAWQQSLDRVVEDERLEQRHMRGRLGSRSTAANNDEREVWPVLMQVAAKETRRGKRRRLAGWEVASAPACLSSPPLRRFVENHVRITAVRRVERRIEPCRR